MINNRASEKEVIQPWPLVKIFMLPFVQKLWNTLRCSTKNSESRFTIGISTLQLDSKISREKERYRIHEGKVYNKLYDLLWILWRKRKKSVAMQREFPGDEYPITLVEIEKILLQSKELAPEGIWNIDPTKINNRLNNFTWWRSDYYVKFDEKTLKFSTQARYSDTYD